METIIVQDTDPAILDLLYTVLRKHIPKQADRKDLTSKAGN